jgi:hypothetical protein
MIPTAMAAPKAASATCMFPVIMNRSFLCENRVRLQISNQP